MGVPFKTGIDHQLREIITIAKDHYLFLYRGSDIKKYFDFWGVDIGGISLACIMLEAKGDLFESMTAANDILGRQVAEIITYGTYSCRNVAGTSSRSQHATANAIDIAGFRLKDGRVVNVQDHWGERSDEGRFLRKVHRGACRLFSVTLGPDYNAAHADHFHFDMGSGDTCK